MNTPDDRLARRLIRHAAAKAPPALSERLEEEWLADMAARSGSMARLRLAIGCCWATKVIAHEFAAPKVLAAGSANGSGAATLGESLAGYLRHDFSFFSRRTLTFLLIIGLHVALIYVFAAGLGRQVIRILPGPSIWKFLPDDPAPSRPPPPLPPPNIIKRTVLDIPLIEDSRVDPPMSEGINAVATAEPQPSGPTPTPPPIHVQRVWGGPGKTFPSTNDFYPPEAIRRGAHGVVTVHTCVDIRGKLMGDPTVAQTSGTASLDEGALKLARAGSGHYRPTTDDGRPVDSCFDFRIKFDLRD